MSLPVSRIVRPRNPSHRGSVEAAGVVIDPSLAAATAHRRVLDVWHTGSRVLEVSASLIVLFPSRQRLNAQTAPGAPLVPVGSVLSSAPLATSELEALDAPPGAIVLVREGVAAVQALDEKSALDVSEWLDFEAEIVATKSLGVAPASPALPAEAPADLRAVFRDRVPPAAPELARVIESIRKANATARPARGAIDAVANMIRTLATWLSARNSRRAASSSRALASHTGSRAHTSSWLDRAAGKLWRWLTSFLVVAGVARLLGRRQAQYVQRMLEFFARRDWENALRHAIPLGGGTGSRPLLGLPSPRARLQIEPDAAQASSALVAGDELWLELRRIYRTAFERLDEAGDHERAAFVLAELLRASEEAVAYLERHGKLRLAAEMAEARELAPGLVVRQWFVAGERERAVDVARRTGAFADAIQRLDRNPSEQQLAAALRLSWAESLASAGDYASAAEVAAKVSDARALVVRWLALAVHAGGPSAARGLAMKLSLGFAPDEQDRHALTTLLENDASDASAMRRLFAEGLARSSPEPWARTLARAAARALLRDAAELRDELAGQAAHSLAKFSGDRALSADLPRVPSYRREGLETTRREAAAVWRYSAGDSGSLPVLDVAGVPGDRVLVALGEAGLRLLARDGRTAAHFDVPTHRIVLSDHADRVLALAPRGEAWRVSRIDLASRRTQTWCEAVLTSFARDFDGAAWFVGKQGELVAIDVFEERLKAIRRLDGLEGAVVEITRTATACAFVTHPWDLERFQIELPSWVLRVRRDLHLGEAMQGVVFDCKAAVWPDDGYALLWRSLKVPSDGEPTDPPPEWSPPAITLARGAHGTTLHLANPAHQPIHLAMNDEWCLAALQHPSGTLAVLVDRAGARVRARIELEASKSVTGRFQGSTLWLGDDRGRAIALDLRSTLARILRVA